MIFWVLFLTMNDEKILEVRNTDVSPVIDGYLEEVWDRADSTTNFIQATPYEGAEPSEKTVVYVLQDRENLFFAFKCYGFDKKPVSCLTGNEGAVKVAIDPFGSKSTAYYFTVYCSETIHDGWLLDDGRREDDSWEGVWYRAVEMHEDRYFVEIKIPFKSIRYKKGLKEWGIQFKRYIAEGRESNYWTEVDQIETDMVSRFGTLKGIEPHSMGFYFELYPEGYARYDKYMEEEGEISPSLSLNFKWDITPQSTLNATINPDYAQIEADPFQLNLDRYPIYLDEKRPFFLEGKDIFRLSDFGEGKGFYKPLDIFYSRKIGRSVDGEPIPILGGLKFTHKTEQWNAGVLGAYTDEFSENDSILEPERGFGAVRVKRSLMKNSDIGMLFSGSVVNGDNYNYAVGVDGVYRKGISQLIVQGAVSDRNGKKGWALSGAYFGWLANFMSIFSAEVVSDSFDVSDIGYVPWSGRKQVIVMIGPLDIYKEGFLKTNLYGPTFMAVEEQGSENWSYSGGFMWNPNFRNNWGFNAEVGIGKSYEMDTNYIEKTANLSVWGNGNNYNINFGGGFYYDYNYRRNYIANNLDGWLSGSYTIIPQLSFSLMGYTWVEWNPDNELIAITPRLTPRLTYNYNADVEFQIFNEFVFDVPGSSVGEAELITNRLGFLFSWNFKPKSWIYVALNDFRIKEGEEMKLYNQVGAIKMKYLLYF